MAALIAVMLAAPAAGAPDDGLVEALRTAPDAATAEMAEAALREAWSRSGSDSVDFLFERGHKALGEQNLAAARTMFDSVIELAPEFAEGWHARATLNYAENRHEDALRDLRRALDVNPRHFAALAGLGTILEEYGDKAGALAAYRRALAVYPLLQGGIPERVRALEPAVDGRGI